MSPRNAEDEYLRWEILSGKDVIRFDDDDRNDDEIEFKALKEESASVRCYVKGKDKTKYGDTIKISIQKKNDYTFQSYGKSSKTVEVDDDLELKVKKGSSIKEKQLKWTIANKKLLRQSFRLCQRSFLFLLLSYASLECFIFRNTGT